jgi:hypothetical protein
VPVSGGGEKGLFTDVENPSAGCLCLSVQELFTDVYAGPGLPKHLDEQFQALVAHVKRHPDYYDTSTH